MELERKILKDGVFVEFVDMTQKYGRAEFVVCPQFKRGKLVKLSIYPKQQENANYFLEWEAQSNGKNRFSVQGYEGLGEPFLWNHFYCKEHKCQSFRMYVPTEAKYIWFSEYSDNVCIGFTKSKW